MILKDILGDALFGQVEAAVEAVNSKITDKTKKIKLVDLSDGGYVSAEKYKDKTSAAQKQIDDLQAQITQRDTDLKDLQKQLDAAQGDSAKYADVSAQLTALQADYDAKQKEAKALLTRQAYEFMVKEKAGELKFSSAAAKKEFIREATAKEFKIDGERLLGYDDFLKDYQASDPGAFAPAEEPAPAPQIILPTGGTVPKGNEPVNLSELMKRANENPNMDIKF